MAYVLYSVAYTLYTLTGCLVVSLFFDNSPSLILSAINRNQLFFFLLVRHLSSFSLFLLILSLSLSSYRLFLNSSSSHLYLNSSINHVFSPGSKKPPLFFCFFLSFPFMSRLLIWSFLLFDLSFPFLVSYVLIPMEEEYERKRGGKRERGGRLRFRW